MRAVIAGASGLVGSHVLRLLLQDASCEHVTALVRRDLTLLDAKLTQRVVDFDRLGVDDVAGAHCIFCCLGTTAATAGSKDAQRQVDYAYPLALATVGLAAGAKHYLLVSSIGSNAQSKFFYTRLKGELERDLTRLGYNTVTIVRPGMVLGDRAGLKQDPRPTEQIAQRVAPLVDTLLRGQWRKYHSIPAETVAAAMVARSRSSARGGAVLEYADLVEAAQSSAGSMQAM